MSTGLTTPPSSARKPEGVFNFTTEAFKVDASSLAGSEQASPRKTLFVKKKAHQTNWAQMVTLECMDDDGSIEEFVLHKCFLIRYSEFYERAFNGPFIEGETQSIQQHPCSLESFRSFIQWFYTQSLLDDKGLPLQLRILVDVWIYGDEMLVPKLKNLAIMVIHEELQAAVDMPTRLFTRLYLSTSPDSPLRRVFADACAARLTKMDFGEDVPREMLVDILKASAELKNIKGGKFTKERAKTYLVSEEAHQRRSGSGA